MSTANLPYPARKLHSYRNACVTSDIMLSVICGNAPLAVRVELTPWVWEISNGHN